VEAAINRYRILAVTVGVMLLVLVFVAMPIRYIGGNATPSGIVSPIHGTLYIVYLAFAFDLYRRAGWELKQFLIMVSAGLVPFLAFFVEKKIVRDARALVAADPSRA
jgi:integral membrane protein